MSPDTIPDAQADAISLLAAREVARAWSRADAAALDPADLTAIELASQGQTPAQFPPLPPLLPNAVPAFPGAWGGGMFTTGGRGGKAVAASSQRAGGHRAVGARERTGIAHFGQRDFNTTVSQHQCLQALAVDDSGIII